ncbi:hypothetical protein Pcinc_008983 [Petrolisthes cinctipes]|uniref:Solute carrier family 10 member 6 n=1 Tax=Petrolisthes cinctipes TaxID=88211 RepID=A0AAE1KYY0_PETCI|nr:hypothetical protein Pcinc_008983 [Petrolisthes cinctipes]
MAEGADESSTWLLEVEYDNETTAVVVVEEMIEPWRKKLDLAATVILTLNTVTFMLGMGAAIYIKEVWLHAKRPVGVFIGMVGQFLVMPAFGFALSLAFHLQPYEALGVLMISCSPGGTFSNFFTYWLDGDLALRYLVWLVG